MARGTNRHPVGELVRQPELLPVGRSLEERRETRLILRREIERGHALRLRASAGARIAPEYVEPRDFLARDEGKRAVGAEPHLRRPVHRLQITQRAGLLQIHDRDAILAAYSDPELAPVAAKCGLVRLATNENAGREPLSIGARRGGG